MKLSDIKGADVFDVIADCIVPITNLAADEKAMALFKKQVVPEGTDVRAVAIKRLAAGVPPLMRDHKDDLVAILAAVNLTPVDEYAKELTLGKLITDLADLIGDPMFADFFTSAEGATATTSVQGAVAASAIYTTFAAIA